VPPFYESIQPVIGGIASLAREVLKVALRVAATVLFEREDSHRNDPHLLRYHFWRSNESDSSAGPKNCCVCIHSVPGRPHLVELSQSRRHGDADSQRQQAAARKSWNPSDKPEWLDDKAYGGKILPRVVEITVPAIMSVLAVSEPYAINTRSGRCIPRSEALGRTC
jgi:hypothetical protein